MNNHNLSTFLSVRVNAQTRKEFHDKAKAYGKSADVLREIVEAFIDERLVISKPNPRKKELYHVRSKD
jgi:hypothetical protein